MEVALVSGDKDLLQIADHINPDSQNQGREKTKIEDIMQKMWRMRIR